MSRNTSSPFTAPVISSWDEADTKTKDYEVEARKHLIIINMNEEILKKLELSLERNVARRSFLRGSGLVALAIVGVAASPLMGYAQEQTQDEKKKAAEKKAEEDAKAAAEKKAADKKSDDKNETKLDAEGREYRECPQCGSNMYRQGRTWTCENCGYSYVE